MLNRSYRAHWPAHTRTALLGASDGELRGIAIVYPADRWPPPPRSFVHEAWGVVAGARRAACARRARSTPFIRTSPTTSSTRSGSTRRTADRRRNALLERIAGHAEARGVPIHLTTSAPENLPYYRRFGYELDGERELPRRAPMVDDAPQLARPSQDASIIASVSFPERVLLAGC